MMKMRFSIIKCIIVKCCLKFRGMNERRICLNLWKDLFLTRWVCVCRINEIYSISFHSEPNNRGFLLASLTLSISFGILLCHILGTFFHYKIVAFAASIIPVFICTILLLVPESPIWLLTRHRVEEAKTAFLWLRGHHEDSLTELECLVKKHEKLKKEDDADNVGSDLLAKLKVNINKPEFLRPLGIILFFFFVMQFSGVNSVAFYTVSLMKSINESNGNEYFSMILIDTVRVFASIIACILLKLCFRRTLMLVSGIGTAVCLISASLFMYLDSISSMSGDFSWHSIAFLIGYICFVSIGLFPLPWVNIKLNIALFSEHFFIIFVSTICRCFREKCCNRSREVLAQELHLASTSSVSLLLWKRLYKWAIHSEFPVCSCFMDQ